MNNDRKTRTVLRPLAPATLSSVTGGKKEGSGGKKGPICQWTAPTGPDGIYVCDE